MKTILAILILGLSSIFVTGQVTDTNKPASAAPVNKPNGGLHDFAFTGGVDLQFLIRTIARDLDLNVLFDAESRLENRRAKIELRNVTTAAALDALLLQEGLYFEEAGPKTILVASRVRGVWVTPIGIGTLPMGKELAGYFGVSGGVLINTVRTDSPASKAGLRAGDVIVGIDGANVQGTIGLIHAIDDRKQDEATLTIVRDRNTRTVIVTLQKGVEAMLPNL